MALDPHEVGDTSTRWGCGSEPVDIPIFVRIRFIRCASTVTPACQWKMSPNKERVSCDGEWGGGATPLLFIFSLFFFLL
jgi:hypothetical protein